MLEGPGQGEDNAHDEYDELEDGGADGAVGQGVEDLSAGEDVEADEEDVVQQQADGGQLVRYPRGAGEYVGGHVANVADFRVHHVELPEDVGGVEGDETEANGEQRATDDAEDGPGPGKGQNREGDVFRKEQTCRSLPLSIKA